jgi:uncharacterized membrane protein YkvA (DUF1232 family)
VTFDGLFGALAVALAVWVTLIAVLILAGRGALARELVTLVPDLVALFAGLIRDPGVPRRAKLVLALASVWLASPIDLVPEFIPVAGPLDDAIVAALALRYVLRVTDPSRVRAHWRGSDAMLARLLRLAGRAD